MVNKCNYCPYRAFKLIKKTVKRETEEYIYSSSAVKKMNRRWVEMWNKGGVVLETMGLFGWDLLRAKAFSLK